MKFKQKLLAALAGSTSQTPIDTATLARGHFRCRVQDELQVMLQAHEVCHCQIVHRGQRAVDVWWLPGIILNATYNQTIKANRKTQAARARAALALDGDGDGD